MDAALLIKHNEIDVRWEYMGMFIAGMAILTRQGRE